MFILFSQVLIVLFVYFIFHLILFKIFKINLNNFFIYNLSLINLITLFVVLIRLLLLVYAIVPFYEKYILYLIGAVINYFSPNYFNPRDLSTYSAIITNIFSSILLVCHIFTQLIFIKAKNLKNIIIVITFSILSFLAAIIVFGLTQNLINFNKIF